MLEPLHEPIPVFLTIMAVILVTPLLSVRVHLPGIVGLILGGMLVGPHVLGVLDVSQSIELLATVGLLYLMFNAGLEIDLRQFSQVRKKALLFGLSTFAVPQILGTMLGRAMGFGWNSSLLLGSIFASHTLVAFPIVSRLGIVRNQAIAATIGATVFTDVGSLLVLAIVANASTGEGSPTYVIRLILLMIAYAVVVLVGVPRLGKWFFRRFVGRAVELQFVLLALFVSAALAERIGMHGIVGAFLAGLAINSTVPARSPVAGRVLFLGESLFIPTFLIYIGMMTDPLAVVASRQALTTGLVLTGLVYVAKFLAAWIAGRLSQYSWDEILTMWGLSQAQAAATLAAVLVGVKIELFPPSVFDGAILMILCTCITSPLLTQRFGARLQPVEPTPAKKDLFARILVAISNPETEEHLITLADILSRTGEGMLMPIHIAQDIRGEVVGLEHQRKLLEAAILRECEASMRPLARIDGSIARGILHASLENDATLIVMGWRGVPTFRESILGTVLDEVVWNATIPVLVGRMTTPINAIEGVVLVVPPRTLPAALASRTSEMALALARAINVPLLLLAAERHQARLQAELAKLDPEQQYEVKTLGDSVTQDVVDAVNPQHLVMITSMGSSVRFRSSLGHLPEQIAAATSGPMLVIHYPSQPRQRKRAAAE